MRDASYANALLLTGDCAKPDQLHFGQRSPRAVPDGRLVGLARRIWYPKSDTHMDGSMKTTVDTPEALLREARKLAAREGVTLEAFIERGLRQVIEARQHPPFKLRRVSFKGKGLSPGLQNASWDAVLDHAYEGRGC